MVHTLQNHGNNQGPEEKVIRVILQNKKVVVVVKLKVIDLIEDSKNETTTVGPVSGLSSPDITAVMYVLTLRVVKVKALEIPKFTI